jgi:hypothetical protein
VAAVIPDSIVVFIVLSDGMGCPSLSLRQEEAESQNNKHLITIKHIYDKNKKIIVTLIISSAIQICTATPQS